MNFADPPNRVRQAIAYAIALIVVVLVAFAVARVAPLPLSAAQEARMNCDHPRQPRLPPGKKLVCVDAVTP